MQVEIHSIEYQRNTRTGQWMASCTGCIWALVGSRDEVQARAATHDMEWECVEVEQPARVA